MTTKNNRPITMKSAARKRFIHLNLMIQIIV